MIIIPTLSYGQIFITELADPIDATTCRYVELYNAGATAVDLGAAGYGIQRYTNGNTEPQNTIHPLTGTIAPGGFYIVARSGFIDCYGFEPDLILNSGTSADSNGDDQIQILDSSSAVVDIFGVPGEDGTGTCHDFFDGRAERSASVTTGNSGTWNEANWNVTGNGTPTGCTNHTTGTVSSTDNIFDPGAWIGAPVTSVDSNLKEKISFYPNPAKNFINISNLENIEIANIGIYNILGKLIENVDLKKESIDISGLANGVYLLKILDKSGQKETFKIIKSPF